MPRGTAAAESETVRGFRSHRCRATGSRHGSAHRHARLRWRYALSSRTTRRMLAAQLHERRQWIVAPERMDIRPDPHVQRRVALDGSLRISIAVDEGLVGEDGEEETFEPVRIVDHLPQHLEGIHEIGRAHV